MKQKINEYDFVRAFDEMDRSANFSRAGRFALYEYLTEYEEDTGEELELDIIALCSDFTEWESLDEFRANYGNDYRNMDDVRDAAGHVIINYCEDVETRFITYSF